MTINGKEQTVPVDQIEAVNYTGPPQAYSVGVVREQSNNLTDALEQYQKAIAASGDRPLMAREAQFARTRVLAGIIAEPQTRDRGDRGGRKFPQKQSERASDGPCFGNARAVIIQKDDFERADRAVET